MPNNEWVDSNGLTKELYEVLWEDHKIRYISSFKSASNKEKLINSQKQEVIRLIEKKKRKRRR